MVGLEVGQEDKEETFRQVEEEMARLEEHLVGLEEDQEEDEARLATEDKDELVPPGTFGFSSTSPLSGHDVSDDCPQDQAIQDLIYLICWHTYMNGVLFNTVVYRHLLNSTELVIVISSFSVTKSLGPFISKNAKKNGWVDGQSCFAMSMNTALLYALDDDKRTLINFTLLKVLLKQMRLTRACRIHWLLKQLPLQVKSWSWQMILMSHLLDKESSQ